MGRLEICGRYFEDPCEIPFKYKDKISPDLYIAIFKVLEEKYGHLINKEFEDPNTGAVVLCGGEIVARGSYPEEIAEDLERIGKTKDKICFLFGNADLVEESSLEKLAA